MTRQLGLYTQSETEHTIEAGVNLPPMLLSEHVVQDFAATGLSLRPIHFISSAHTSISFVFLPPRSSKPSPTATRLPTAGLILVRQRPGTAKGVCFITIKDETGITNLIVWPKVFEEYRIAILSGKLILFTGHYQISQDVTHVIVQAATNLNSLFSRLTPDAHADLKLELSRADERDGTTFPDSLKNPGAAAMPDGRNFK